MLYLIYFFIFLFGTIIGSFLNCFIYRLKNKESFLIKRSYCPHCKHSLKWIDLIPILSFLFLKGKCHYCQRKISIQYPLVELITGFLFILIFQHFDFRYDLGILDFFTLSYFLISVGFLIIIFVYDLKYYIIPDKVVFSAIGVSSLYHLFGFAFGNWNLFRIWDLGLGVLPSLFFLAIILFSKGRWMGLGDFKLAIFMGLFLGWPNILVAFAFAFLIGSLVGITLIVLRKKTIKSMIPFGPFLVSACFIALFFGEKIITWYLALFSI